MNDRRTSREPRPWRVVHTFDLGGADVRKARILQRPPSKHFVFEIGMKGHIGDELSWVPFGEDVFTERIVRRINREIIQLLGRLALERLELTEHALAVADTDKLLASLELGEPIEVQLGGTCRQMKETGECDHYPDHAWIPATFVGIQDGWVRVSYDAEVITEYKIDPDDPQETLIMQGHVRRSV